MNHVTAKVEARYNNLHGNVNISPNSKTYQPGYALSRYQTLADRHMTSSGTWQCHLTKGDHVKASIFLVGHFGVSSLAIGQARIARALSGRPPPPGLLYPLRLFHRTNGILIITEFYLCQLPFLVLSAR